MAASIPISIHYDKMELVLSLKMLVLPPPASLPNVTSVRKAQGIVKHFAKEHRHLNLINYKIKDSNLYIHF